MTDNHAEMIEAAGHMRLRFTEGWRVEHRGDLRWCIIEPVEVIAHGYPSAKAAQREIDNPAGFFWALLDAVLENPDVRQAEILSDLIDEYRPIGLDILRDAERDPELKAKYERALAIAGDGPYEVRLIHEEEKDAVLTPRHALPPA